jgi:hypothetical protein
MFMRYIQDLYMLQSATVVQRKLSVIIQTIGKAIPLQARTGPEGTRRLRLPDFKTFGT